MKKIQKTGGWLVAGNSNKGSNFSLQQVTIQAEVHCGEAAEEETKVNFWFN